MAVLVGRLLFCCSFPPPLSPFLSSLLVVVLLLLLFLVVAFAAACSYQPGHSKAYEPSVLPAVIYTERESCKTIHEGRPLVV